LSIIVGYDEKPVKIPTLKMIGHIIDTFKSSINTSAHPIHYRISGIDQDNQTVMLHVIHKRIFIKLTFSEIISNTEVIEGLSSQNACWIGVYYGMALRRALDRKGSLKNIKKPTCLLKHEYGSYKILCENRDGTIGCLHLKSRKELTIDPISIAKDELLIKQFDATQACYVGILAGIAIEKKQNHALLATKQFGAPYLRLVK
jgi:hypothetical protein